MPNPLTQLGQRITSKTPPERPKPTPPVPESYEGHNNPWRGTEEHGVAPNNEPSAPGTLLDNRTGVHYEAPERAIDPIPVEIVNNFGREFRRWRPLRVTVDNTHPVQLAGRNTARSSIYILNRSAEVVLVDFSAQVNAVTSFELPAGGNITIPSEDAVWLLGLTATMLAVSAFENYAIQEP